jgi:hypothetical protein
MAKTKPREKYTVYLDDNTLTVLRDYHDRIGVSVSESIRRAIESYCKTLKTR